MKNLKKNICCFLFFVTCATLSARKKAMIVGATSGMGRQLAKLLSKDYDVGLAGRRINLLESLQKEIQTKTYIKQIDVTQLEQTQESLTQLIEEMGGLDLFVITVSGFMDLSSQDNTFPETMNSLKKLIDVDVTQEFLKLLKDLT